MGQVISALRGAIYGKEPDGAPAGGGTGPTDPGAGGGTTPPAGGGTTPPSGGPTDPGGGTAPETRWATLGFDAAATSGFARADRGAARFDVALGNVRLHGGSARPNGAAIDVDLVARPGQGAAAGVAAAFVSFNGFDAKRLPPVKDLENGLRLVATDGSQLHYDAGTLTLSKDEAHPVVGETGVEAVDAVRADLDVRPDFKSATAVRMKVSSSRRRAGAGTSAPQVVTDATLTSLRAHDAAGDRRGPGTDLG